MNDSRSRCNATRNDDFSVPCKVGFGDVEDIRPKRLWKKKNENDSETTMFKALAEEATNAYFLVTRIPCGRSNGEAWSPLLGLIMVVYSKIYHEATSIEASRWYKGLIKYDRRQSPPFYGGFYVDRTYQECDNIPYPAKISHNGHIEIFF